MDKPEMTPPADFSELARLCEGLASTTKRLEKIALIAEFLKGLKEEEIVLASLFLSGRVFSESDPRVLEVGFVALSELRIGQMRLTGAKPLTIIRVAEYFSELASARGRDSRRKRKRLLAALFGEATTLEAKWLVRLISGEMRIGVEDGIMLEAIPAASGLDLGRIRRAHMLLGDLGSVARIALVDGEKGIIGLGELKNYNHHFYYSNVELVLEPGEHEITFRWTGTAYAKKDSSYSGEIRAAVTSKMKKKVGKSISSSIS